MLGVQNISAASARLQTPVAAPSARWQNVFSVDVEDYFQVQAFADQFPQSSWDVVPRRVEANIDRILEMFADKQVHATFFTLGWIAEDYVAHLKHHLNQILGQTFETSYGK